MSLVINSYNYPYQGWKSVPSTGSQTLIRVSGSGQIQYSVFGTNGLYKSIDYGKTWSYVNFINYYISSLEISDSGQIIYVADSVITNQTNNVYKSSDFGNTWSILNPLPILQPYLRQYLILNSSNNGSEVMLFAPKLQGPDAFPPKFARSIDGGNTFTYTEPTSLPDSSSGDVWSIESSRDFSVIYAKRFYSISTGGRNELYKSIDYGVNWVNCFTDDTNLLARRRVSTSRNGEFIIIHEELSQTVGNLIISTVISKDYGVTWNPILGNSNFAAFSDDNKYITLLQAAGIGANAYVSTDGGLLFKYRSSFPPISDISMSLDGRFQSLATNNLVWINNNFGY